MPGTSFSRPPKMTRHTPTRITPVLEVMGDARCKQTNVPVPGGDNLEEEAKRVAIAGELKREGTLSFL